jgi:hypothetical protein
MNLLSDAASDLFVHWDANAPTLGWTARELFGLHVAPEWPAATYRRLSRYDGTGLIWLLNSRPVIALKSAGAVLIYRDDRQPALGRIDDNLDDLGVCS